jgi:hypothetical protein
MSALEEAQLDDNLVRSYDEAGGAFGAKMQVECTRRA